MEERTWIVYLSGEIHTDWRDQVAKACAHLPVIFTSAVTDHAASDDCGVAILGAEDRDFWKDHKGALVNSIRTRTLLSEADVVVVRFGDKYRQWNAAFEAGQAQSAGKPLVILHDESLDHALKEIDAAAAAVCRKPDQVARILDYVIRTA